MESICGLFQGELFADPPNSSVLSKGTFEGAELIENLPMTPNVGSRYHQARYSGITAAQRLEIQPCKQTHFAFAPLPSRLPSEIPVAASPCPNNLGCVHGPRLPTPGLLLRDVARPFVEAIAQSECHVVSEARGPGTESLLIRVDQKPHMA